jgi:UDP-N-acetylglucosamine 2-epimerase (non-hydrolysing)
MGIMSWVLEYRKPERVIVQGDTATAFGTALAAFHAGYPIYHVEAGLRTWDKDQPFPEEVYRHSISAMADVHFCPTVAASKNILQPTVKYITGNTVIDAVQALAPENPTLTNDVIVTLHRRESPVVEYAKALAILAENSLAYNFKVIIHPNQVGQALKENLEYHTDVENLHLLPPMDYLAFIRELASCYLVITDSGGLQEEAPALNKPVVVMREKTERPEGLGLTSRLAAPDELVNLTERLLYDKTEYFLTASAKNPFGDGKASGRIAEVLNA